MTAARQIPLTTQASPCAGRRVGKRFRVWLPIALLLIGCNRRPREVDFDLTLLPDVSAPRPTIGSAPPELYVPAGTLVRVLVHNRSSSVHNFVLVQPGHVDDVLAAATAPPGDRSAEGAQAAVLARSPWVAPGQSQAVVFVAPPAGYYEFTCTCSTASHGSPLRGKLVVQ